MEDDSIINELFDKINNLEKNNEILRKDINKIKKEITEFDNKNKPENMIIGNNNEEKCLYDKNKYKFPTEEEDEKATEKFMNDYKNVKFNTSLKESIQYVTIQYTSMEQHSVLYILGDFTKWAPVQMTKYKDLFKFSIVLLRGFKYYYYFQAGDQSIVDYNNLFEENPKNLITQNYIDLGTGSGISTQFDSESDMAILNNYII